MTSVSLICADELAKLIRNQKDIVLLDARISEEFERGHIPGAQSTQWFDWCSKAPAQANSELFEAGYWGNLQVENLEEAEARLGNLGITRGGTVVVYSNGLASKGREGRIAWMLLYYGLEDVRILDGGFGAWLSAGGDTNTEIFSGPKTNFEIVFAPERRIDLRSVRKLLEEDRGTTPLLVDTRSPDEFEGKIFDYQPRKGRLPRSVNIWFERYFEADGKFLSSEKFQALLQSENAQSGIKASYCEVGVRAATFALLYEMATGVVLPVFDGSIMEWSLNADLAVISGCQSSDLEAC